MSVTNYWLSTFWLINYIHFKINSYLCTLKKAFFSILQNQTDKGTLLVSKSLPVINSSSVNRLFSATKINSYVSSSGTKFASRYRTFWLPP